MATICFELLVAQSDQQDLLIKQENVVEATITRETEVSLPIVQTLVVEGKQ